MRHALRVVGMFGLVMVLFAGGYFSRAGETPAEKPALPQSAGTNNTVAVADTTAKTVYDFTSCFPQFVKDPSTQNTLSLEESGFVAGKPALRMDCRNLKGRLIVVNFYVPDDRLASFRGKPIVFRSQVKWLEGEGTLSVTLRCSVKKKDEKNELIVWTSATFKGEKGKWVPFELHCMIPDRDDLIYVNFHTGLTKSNKPAVILLDECSMTLDDSGENAPKRPVAFAAYETPPGAQPLVLVRDGKPAATIIVSEPMSSSVRFAVQELNEHLELSTGVKLAVAKDGDTISGPSVHVGKTTLTSRLGLAPEFLSPDNWTVCRAGDALILSGGDNTINAPPWNRGLVPFGTLYAVYEFLERVVGVRWYWPGDLGRVVPKHDIITVGNVAWDGAPSYDTRFAFYSKPKEFSGEETCKWWRRLRWGGVGGSPVGMHAFGHWNKKFGKEYPEWFALQRNGQRGNNPDASGNEAGHLCYSNPDVLKAVIAEKREYLDKNPATRYATVMDGDSSDLYWCQCPNCQAMVRPQAGRGGMYSHPMWKFVNQVAAEIRKSHPDRIITCCAYSSYSAMPEDVEFLPNVSATLCVGYLPNVWRPSCKSDYLKLIRDWSKKTAYIYVWDYLFARRGVGVYGAPSIMPHAFKEWYAMEQGRIKGHVIELAEIYSDGKSSHDWADWMFDALNMYVNMKLLWNLDQDVDKMLAEHYELFYGPAAPLIRKFYDEMEAAWVNPDNKGFPEPKWDWSVCWTMTYPPEFIQRVMGYLREAEKITKGKDPYHARAEKLLIGFLPFEAASLRYSLAGAAIQNEKLELPETGAAPVIDGKPDDACWQTAVVAKDFCDMFNNPKLQVQTAMRFLRDRNNLYVAIQADLKDPKYKRTLAPDSRDGWVWEQESCELFFVQENKKYQFLIGPDNIYADNFHPDFSKQEFKMEMFKWNCAGVQYKSVAGEKGWTAEIAIPLASLELPAPTKEKPWRVNFCRNHFYTEGSPVMQLERSSWRPTFGSFHNVERFGKLFFMNQ